jgi:LDH2 family malate/lactate/ureidoglycolate dehydrogenase
MEPTVRHPPADLSGFAAAALEAVGVPREHAATTAGLLVAADLRGRTGHGLIRLPPYVARIRAGGLSAEATTTVLHETPVSAQIDGANGLGQVVMSHATDLAIEKAAASGLAWVGTTRSNHAGAAGLYVERAADLGLVGIYLAVANANGMPPWGGTDPILGTNPLAIGIPRADGHPFILDIATTNASHGTIKVAAREGSTMPEGWVVDHDGTPITDPARADEGNLVPMGGYKGTGLTIAIGLLAGVINGAAFGRDVVDQRFDLTAPTNTGQSILVLRPDLFGDRDTVLAELGRQIDDLRSSATPDGSPVRLPGDEAVRVRHDNEANGVDVPDGLAQELARLAADLGVPSPFDEQEQS